MSINQLLDYFSGKRDGQYELAKALLTILNTQDVGVYVRVVQTRTECEKIVIEYEKDNS